MSTLDITTEKAKQLDAVETEALGLLQRALKGEIDIDDSIQLAIKSANMVAKNRQTISHAESIRMGMVSLIADEKELRRYVLATQPHVKKLITK